MIRDDATQRQIEAAAPRRSTWLSANAGSGKTRVLTDRVARLLLSGVQPQRILCLTYTKAAASEMQNRLFRRLGSWAMLDDEALRAELETMGAEPPYNLREARTLFARAIETPGGLKIQTIHSFCASVLRRFPLEAGVSPQFTEMEDRAGILLRSEILDSLASGPHRDAVAGVAAYLTDESFEDIARDIAARSDSFAAPLPDAELNALFGLPPGFDTAALLDHAIPPDGAAILQRILPALAAGSSTDARAAERLSGLDLTGVGALEVLEGVFLSGASAKEPFCAKIGSFPTKATRGALGAAMDPLEGWMRRVESARPLRLGLDAARRLRALHDFSSVFLPAWEAGKQARGWLDFDDLILRTKHLLDNPAVAAWVLYRLDGGIDHILVDEAQDTSPVQWEVIERLAREITSGEGAQPDRVRTIFVVGDRKQSIYSFQGADPAEFDRMRDDFADRLAQVNTPLQVLELAYSFRSAPAILALVDTVFEGRASAGFTSEEPHRAFKTAMPGRVDLWPPVEPVTDKDERPWTDPVDQLGQTNHNVILARSIAAGIRDMLDGGARVPVDAGHGSFVMRPVTAGDVLILVQRRSDLFNEVIRACKEAGLPIAGADRLKVGAELAVRDLAAVLSFLAMPEDDLALATALKSPLLGWDEQMLYDLAHRRAPGPLWPALRARRDEFPRTMAILDDLRDRTDFLRPYDLVERILTRYDGRRRLLARLGEEAEDGIDALLDQTLAYERTEVPSLTGFLVWLASDELEIKRQVDSAGDRIRVMTVHGAKGLESPIVILPDAAARRAPPADRLLPVGEGRFGWGGAVDTLPGPLRTARDALIERRLEERDRLLYVALTRAETWLIVAAAGNLGKDGEAWHDRVRTGMQTLGATEAPMPTGPGLRLENGDWQAAGTDVALADAEPTVTVPEMFRHPAAPPPLRPATRSPSDLGGAKALPGEDGLDTEQAKRRGTQVHLLLEMLPQHPPADWPATAARILSRGAWRAEGEELRLLLDEAARVLTRPDLGPLFAPDALAEVPVTANLAELGGARLHGVIDRLVVAPDHVLAVDFKTNATVPERPQDCPEGLLRQMGAYAAALAQIYPDRRIDLAILWTRNATLMHLPHDLVTRALAAASPA